MNKISQRCVAWTYRVSFYFGAIVCVYFIYSTFVFNLIKIENKYNIKMWYFIQLNFNGKYETKCLCVCVFWPHISTNENYFSIFRVIFINFDFILPTKAYYISFHFYCLNKKERNRNRNRPTKLQNPVLSLYIIRR